MGHSENSLRVYLVRIGVDQAFGGWNAPVDPVTGEFVYVPIPESAKEFHPNCCRTLSEFLPALRKFCDPRNLDLLSDLHCDVNGFSHPIHLDPDFSHLTYGDDGGRRGAEIKALTDGDLIVFYAGLRPISLCGHKLLYALVGVYEVAEVVPVSQIIPDRWHQNAHTRKKTHWPHDIVVRAKKGVSGRLERCLPIGEWRDGAYRVRKDLLEAWGGLSVKDGYIQRSAVPPSFLKPEKFVNWLHQQRAILIERNN
jgi:hypothetical protein